MTTHDPTAEFARRAAGLLSERFSRLFSTLESLRPSVQRLIEDNAVLEAGDLRTLEGAFVAALRECDDTVRGLSFSSECNVVADKPYVVAYWVRARGGAIADFPETTPELEEHYEYHEFDFFLSAQAGMSRTLSGPYVDYGYDHEYRLTMAVPVLTSRGFVGVLTADLFLHKVESAVAEVVREAPGPIVIVNDDARVVVSNRASLSAGVLFAASHEWRSIECDAVAWKVFWLRDG